MNVCKERGSECDLATELGFCSVTGCMKQNRVSNVAIIPTVTVTDSPMVEYAPIVRCKDCKYCYAEGFVNVRNVCEKHYDFGNVDDDWFCADGERKDPCS